MATQADSTTTAQPPPWPNFLWDPLPRPSPVPLFVVAVAHHRFPPLSFPFSAFFSAFVLGAIMTLLIVTPPMSLPPRITRSRWVVCVCMTPPWPWIRGTPFWFFFQLDWNYRPNLSLLSAWFRDSRISAAVQICVCSPTMLCELPPPFCVVFTPSSA